MPNTKTSIEWTDVTWNPVTGCDKVSPGCTHCYAGDLAETRLKAMQVPAYRNGFFGNVLCHPDRLGQPFKIRGPKRIFVNSMSDLFHEDVPFEYIAAVFGVMAACPHHTFQVLTKRPKRMLEWFRWVDSVVLNDSAPWFKSQMCQDMLGRYVSSRWDAVWECAVWPLPNVWLGVSVEDQKRADERIPLLLQCPAPIRFLSCEPLLGPLDLSIMDPGRCNCEVCTMSYKRCPASQPYLDWVIVGGESGRKARPMEVEWARSVKMQCNEADVPFFFKQGSHANWPRYKDFASFPADLQAREFPA